MACDNNSEQKRSENTSSFVVDFRNQSLKIIESSSDEILKSIALDNEKFIELIDLCRQESIKSRGSPLSMYTSYNGSNDFIVRECDGKKYADFYLTFQNKMGTKMFLFFVECYFGGGMLPYRKFSGYTVEQSGNVFKIDSNEPVPYDEFVKLINPIDL